MKNEATECGFIKRGQENTMNSWEISKAILTWNSYPGFVGEYCQCGATVNTLGGCGYFCPNCYRFNTQCFSGGMMPHQTPEFGPTLTTIRKGMKIADRYSRKAHKFIVGQKVWVNKNGYPHRNPCVLPGFITRGGSDCWPGVTHYYVAIVGEYDSNGEQIERHTFHDDICKRTKLSTMVRQDILSESPWLGCETDVPIWHIVSEVKKRKELGRHEELLKTS